MGFVLAFSGATGPRIPPVAAQQSLQEYLLSPGDSIEITVLGEADLSRTVPIRPDGRINLPLVGDLVAAGLTPAQLTERIMTALRVFIRNPQVTVTVREYQRAFVYLVGHGMARTGPVELRQGWTLLDVMAAAGGVAPRAALRRATLIRRATGATVALDLERLLVKGDRGADASVEPGDIIMVPLLQNRVLVLGSVGSPGAHDLDDGARLLDAVAMAGGALPRSATNNVGLIRHGPDGKPVVTPVDLNKMLKGDMSQNVAVQHGDVIYVPQGPLVRFQDILAWLAGLSLVRATVGGGR